MHVATIGGVVKPGNTLIDIVPESDQLIILAALSTQDIGYVRKGQTALVKLASRDAGKFGQIHGTVLHISPDTVTTGEGLPHYEVQISTKTDYFQSGILRYYLTPGVRVLCAIKTGERTVLEYLIGPFLNSMHTALRER